MGWRRVAYSADLLFVTNALFFIDSQAQILTNQTNLKLQSPNPVFLQEMRKSINYQNNEQPHNMEYA